MDNGKEKNNNYRTVAMVTKSKAPISKNSYYEISKR